METCPTNVRQGFTLLEVLLAAAIGVLVMSALYVALEIQLRQTQVGREVVEESVLVRSLLQRMSQDIASSLKAPPKSQSASGNALTTLLTGAGEGSESQYNLGLQGSYDRLVLQVSRVPRPVRAMSDSEIVPAPESDVRRITYWMTATGLAREEVKLLTPAELVDPVDEMALVIAPEVRNVQFRYFDGTAWQESWDGTTVDGAGAPKGPPLAVEITLEIGRASEEEFFDPESAVMKWKRFRHVVALPTSSLPVGESTTTVTSP